MNHSSRFVSAAIGTLLLTPAVGFGGLFQRSVKFQVQVVDQQNKPVPYATVWYGRSDENPEILGAFMRREAARAGVEFEFVTHVKFSVILRANAQGRVEVMEDDVDLNRSGHLPAQFVALQHGYQPGFAGLDARIGSKPKVLLKLVSDPSLSIDPRMLSLGRAYSLADEQVDLGMNEAGERKIAEAVNEIRALAGQLEQEGKHELAAAVYYNLAYLPAIQIIKAPDGAIVGRGYSHGYHDDEPQRVADRRKAMELYPGQVMLRMASAGALTKLAWPRTGGKFDADRLRIAVKEYESVIHDFPTRVDPRAYQEVLIQLGMLDQFDDACRVLRELYEYEPAYFETTEKWWYYSNQWERNLKTFTATLHPCAVSGLPPAPPSFGR